MKTKKTKFEKFSKLPNLNKDLLNKVKGGVAAIEESAEITISNKCGHFYTISGECRADGSSCWPWPF
ncbi:hypothetical protein QWZ06_07610 [Chryseobacterium tructae]|uniref:Uncharacterized protein n=1 Tax=Chryseobacterium tructae TaxID=1037380 RepID=A0ABV7XXD5_9FLAO|nr:hypothetical protein [Chryseobacterium tructae]MDN3692135.1 hypothetical protein [Chryseobacterium tructae]